MALTQHQQSGQGVYAASGSLRVPHVACHVTLVGEAADEPFHHTKQPSNDEVKFK